VTRRQKPTEDLGGLLRSHGCRWVVRMGCLTATFSGPPVCDVGLLTPAARSIQTPRCATGPAYETFLPGLVTERVPLSIEASRTPAHDGDDRFAA